LSAARALSPAVALTRGVTLGTGIDALVGGFSALEVGDGFGVLGGVGGCTSAADALVGKRILAEI
jgi:hypothetical protein